MLSIKDQRYKSTVLINIREGYLKKRPNGAGVFSGVQH